MKRTTSNLLKYVFISTLLAALGVITWNRGKVYANDESLWRDTLARNPDSWLANNNLGMILLQRGKIAAAIPFLEKAIFVDPRLIESYNNLAYALMRTGRTDEAIAYLQRAIAIEPQNAPLINSLGAAFMDKGQFADAANCFERAIEIFPDYQDARINLGIARQAQQKH